MPLPEIRCRRPDAAATRRPWRTVLLSALLLLPLHAAAALRERLLSAPREQPTRVLAREQDTLHELELTVASPFTADARIVLMQGGGIERRLADATRYFEVRGRREASLHGVLILRADGTLQGLLRRDDGFAWLDATGDDELRLADVPDVPPEQPFQCDVADAAPQSLRRVAESFGDLVVPQGAVATTHRARIALETDEEFLAKFDDVEEATAYVGGLFTFISSFYEDEIDTRLEISFLRFWETPDPFVQTTNACMLLETGKYWNDNQAGVVRTLAHKLSGRSTGGGIAWVGVLCSGPFNSSPAAIGTSCPGMTAAAQANYGGAYGVTGSLAGNFDASNPQVVWDVFAVAHEIGHNFNSNHTHCYAGIGGNAEPVDKCYSGESGCYAGASSLPGPQGAGSGTVMSYCHLRPGGSSNISLTFGADHPYGVAPERVPARMLAHVQNRAASNAACLVAPIAQAPLNLTATPDLLAVGETSQLDTQGGSGSGAVSFALAPGESECSLAGSLVTGLAPGACDVTATKAGDATYLETTANGQIQIEGIEQEPLVIALDPATLVFGDVAEVQVSGGSGSGAISLAVSVGASRCEIAGDHVEAIGIGSCEITATKAADSTYLASSTTAGFEVGRAPQATLVLSATPAVIPRGGQSALSLAGGSGDGVIAFALVSGPCVLEGTTLTAASDQTGLCVVEATRSGGSVHLPASDDIAVAVVEPALDLVLGIERIDGASARSYRISVANLGPISAPAVRLQVDATDGLLEVLWSCDATPADCEPEAGTQRTDAQFALAPGATAAVELSGQTDTTRRYVVIDAAVEPGDGLTSLSPQDDRRLFVDGIGDSVFGHGFE
jgi:hypothetical protein